MKFDIVKFDPVLNCYIFIAKTTVLFALTLDHRETFKLLREFEPHYLQLKNDNVQFSVYYDQYISPSAFVKNFTQPESDCLGGGLYC